MSTKRNVTYKCPFCDERYNRQDLVNHIDENHQYEIPKDFTAFRYTFNYVNNKPLSYHGKCTECGGSTPWDEEKGRYNRQCGKKACHDSFVKKFEENMVKTRGTTRMSATAEGQIEMLKNRKISGEYKFKNGKVKTYTGSYEKKALEFMDQVMNIDPDDLMCPGPVLEYSMNGKTYIYITDFYYQPYNLIIEVKDGGNNPNKRNMPEYRQKQIAKEQFIIKHTNYNYLRLTDNNLRQLINVFMDLKLQMVENTGERVIHINESSNPIHEYMNALMSGKVVGLRDSEAYVVNYMSNNVFSKIGVTDAKMDTIFGVENDKLVKIPGDEVELIGPTFRLGDKKKISAKLESLIGTTITEKEFYKEMTGYTLYSKDQIIFNLEQVESDPLNKYLKAMDEYFVEKSDIDLIEESVREVEKWINTI